METKDHCLSAFVNGALLFCPFLPAGPVLDSALASYASVISFGRFIYDEEHLPE